eukprot:14020931-Ditylum_brightwellii.AAC.1
MGGLPVAAGAIIKSRSSSSFIFPERGEVYEIEVAFSTTVNSPMCCSVFMDASNVMSSRLPDTIASFSVTLTN